MTRRYRAMHAADGWRLWDGEARRWSESMGRDRCRQVARALNEGRDEPVRWEMAQGGRAA